MIPSFSYATIPHARRHACERGTCASRMVPRINSLTHTLTRSQQYVLQQWLIALADRYRKHAYRWQACRHTRTRVHMLTHAHACAHTCSSALRETDTYIHVMA